MVVLRQHLPGRLLLLGLILLATGLAAACQEASRRGAPGDEANEIDDALDDDLPAFPWPPPRASATARLSLDPARPAEATATLGDVARWLEDGLSETGYGERSYFAVPEGFVLVARLEQIHPDGTPLGPDHRWSLDVSPVRRFSIRTYLQALFRARPGHYRVIAFVVTPRAFTQRADTLDVETAQQWLAEGANALPATVARQPLLEGTRCTALIYEFERPTEDHDVVFKDPGTTPGRTHLEKAHLLDALAR